MILSLRPAIADDKRFIYSTWLLSSRQFVKFLTWEERRNAVQALVDHCDCTVCYPNEDREVILGWSARLGGKLMWVYVQRDARKCGIRRLLTNEAH